MTLSVVVPTLDEARTLPTLLGALDGVDEIIVADGGSRDGTPDIARAAGARVVASARGRGLQLQAGARAARGELLWFLHADTRVPPGAVAALRACPAPWGCFAVRFDRDHPALAGTAAWMNLRARRRGSCTGDMGMWARRAFYEEVGGFPPFPALEDLVFADRARARARPAVLTPAVETSARRFEQRGVLRTLVRMRAVRVGYAAGVSPPRLAAWYRGSAAGPWTR